MLITLLITFVLGYFTYPMVSMTNNYFLKQKKKRETKRLELKKKKLLIAKEISKGIRSKNQKHDPVISSQKKYHLEPKYYDYSGGYDLVTECQKCTMIGLYEDQHPIKPCQFCGGKVETKGAAKWEVIDGQYQWNLGFKNGEEEK
jgi:hypothetical protein